MSLINKIKQSAIVGSILISSSCAAMVIKKSGEIAKEERERQEAIDILMAENQPTNTSLEEITEDSRGNLPVAGSQGPIEGYIPGKVLELNRGNFAGFARKGNKAVLTYHTKGEIGIYSEITRDIMGNFEEAAAQIPYVGFGRVDILKEEELANILIENGVMHDLYLFKDGKIKAGEDLINFNLLSIKAFTPEEIAETIRRHY